MGRSRVVVLLSVALSVMLSMPSPARGLGGFGDAIPGRFYADAVQWMVDNDITTGTTPSCFSPDDPVTRGQAAAFMWRMEDEPDPGEVHSFVDVSAAWQQGPVSWMVNNDITTGTSATMFSPEAPLTRGQLAALLHRLAGEPDAPPPVAFADIVKDWQVTPVGWMVDEGITTGTSAMTFSPDATVTRGQIAAFFHRYNDSPAVEIDELSPRCDRVAAIVGSWEAVDVDGSDITMSVDVTGAFKYHDTATIGRCGGAAQSRDGSVMVSGDTFTVDAVTTCHEFEGNPAFNYDTFGLPYTYNPGNDTITLDLDGACHWRAGTDMSVCS
jgi:hypothetical protein